MFGFKKRRAANRTRRLREQNLTKMVNSWDVLDGWSKDGELSIVIPGVHLLQPSTLLIRRGWSNSFKLIHRIEGESVLIGTEVLYYDYSIRTLEDDKIADLMDSAYDYLWAKIMLAQKERDAAKTLTNERKDKAIALMIKHHNSPVIERRELTLTSS